MYDRAPASEPAAVVIFGASGDLTQRKLIPALHSLGCEGLLNPATQVVGVARTELAPHEFSERLFAGVVDYARLKPSICPMWAGFVPRLSYVAGDYADPDTYRRLAARLDELDGTHGLRGNRLYYLATPPLLYPAVVGQLGQAGLHQSDRGWARIIIEKPFGHDLASALELDTQVHSVFSEEQVYRIDHYLGKETVQNLLLFRFGNAIFEPLWNRSYVDHVQITVAESVGVEHRASYYDRAGVLRDMFQNHVLQLVTLTAMEAPARFTAKALRDEKVKVLQAIRTDPPPQAVWGQYEGYLQEPNVAPGSRTPTYMAARLMIDNWRWQGVPFYVRSGKMLAAKTTEITLRFKDVPHLLFPESAGLGQNSISIYIQPNEGIRLSFATKQPGAGMRAAPVDMAFEYGERFGENALPEAYERLLLDALQGDASLFARSDEIALAWALVDRLAGPVDPAPYPAHSQGPQAAEDLLAADGRAWRPLGGPPRRPMR
ncbi:MAG: glucose-6-phosphate dehydrogenase [Chloroflexota bacterium]